MDKVRQSRLAHKRRKDGVKAKGDRRALADQIKARNARAQEGRARLAQSQSFLLRGVTLSSGVTVGDEAFEDLFRLVTEITGRDVAALTSPKIVEGECEEANE